MRQTLEKLRQEQSPDELIHLQAQELWRTTRIGAAIKKCDSLFRAAVNDLTSKTRLEGRESVSRKLNDARLGLNPAENKVIDSLARELTFVTRAKADDGVVPQKTSSKYHKKIERADAPESSNYVTLTSIADALREDGHFVPAKAGSAIAAYLLSIGKFDLRKIEARNSRGYGKALYAAVHKDQADEAKNMLRKEYPKRMR